MVWALFPVDSVPGEDTYYIFTTGTYKAGRKGCDIIINKDKGVSRIHAEIVVDAMAPSGPQQSKSSNKFCLVQVRDCSKYGTFIKRNLASSKEKVHEFPNKKATLKDGDLISFGTGNATYRFCFVPLKILVYCLEPFQVPLLLQERISSVGACITHTLSEDCTHVLVDQSMPVKEDLIDAIVAKKPVVLCDWIEIISGKKIQTELPSYSSYLPTLAFNGVSVKIADPKCRENCLQGYTFVLDLAYKYKFEDKLHTLLEMGGAKVVSLEVFPSSSQGLVDGENSWVIHVIPIGSSGKLDAKLSSVTRINEVDLVCAVLSGHMDPSLVMSPSILVSSSCSTDETVVADSDVEVETATSIQKTAGHTSDIKSELDVHMHSDHVAAKSESGHIAAKSETGHVPAKSESGHAACFRDKTDVTMAMTAKEEESEGRSSEIIYSQDLIVRNASLPVSYCSSTNNGAINFKCYRKTRTQSGNSFNNLIPFSIHPYKETDHESDVVESMKEEKKRKQMEKLAEDLFNTEKGRRRGTVGSLHEILGRG